MSEVGTTKKKKSIINLQSIEVFLYAWFVLMLAHQVYTISVLFSKNGEMILNRITLFTATWTYQEMLVSHLFFKEVHNYFLIPLVCIIIVRIIKLILDRETG